MTEENTEEIKEETVPIDELGIGEDKPQITAQKVVIEEYEIQDVEKNGKVIGKKLVLKVRHPEIDKRLIDISGAKYEVGDKIKIAGLWINRDTEGKIPFNSAVAHLLRFLGKKTIKELKGEQVNTILDDQNYLVVKAY